MKDNNYINVTPKPKEIDHTPMFIANNGQLIVKTNFWESAFGKNGYYYLSLNAGACRLLVPNMDYMHEIRTGKFTKINLGEDSSGRMCCEVVFEDGTYSPFTLNISLNQMHSLPLENEFGKKIPFYLVTNVDDKIVNEKFGMCAYYLDKIFCNIPKA